MSKTIEQQQYLYREQNLYRELDPWIMITGIKQLIQDYLWANIKYQRLLDEFRESTRICILSGTYHLTAAFELDCGNSFFIDLETPQFYE